MTRRTAVLAAPLLALLVLPAVPAGAGGGCHGGVTQGTGDTVELIDACFTPTTLRIEPGDSVTFVNEDSFVHNVTANLWGHFDDLEQGDSFTATFGEDGVYPYACTYHPGMTGAVVVGDGDGPGSGAAVIGRVVHLHVSDAVLIGEDKIDLASLKPVGRLAGSAYCRVTDVFEMIRPPSQIR